MSIAVVVTRGFGPDASIPFVVTAGYSIGVPATIATDNIITTGPPAVAAVTICDEILIMVGQAQGSTTTRSHSSPVSCGRSLGLALRMGQATGSGTTRSHSSPQSRGRTLGLERRMGQS